MAQSTSLDEDSFLISKPRTQGFVTKRPHRKSRAGCQGCKQRKIKCDEAQPKCAFCVTRNKPCIYLSQVASPASSSSSSTTQSLVQRDRFVSTRHNPYELATAFRTSCSPSSSLCFSNLNPADLMLMHHFTTVTSDTFMEVQGVEVDPVVHYEIPRLALEHDFMMHCVLGLASLHLRKLRPDAPELQAHVAAHRAGTLIGLRKAISQPSMENYRGITAGSLLILILSSDRSTAIDGQLWVTSWFRLWAGMREMIRLISWKYLVESGLRPMFTKDDQPQTTLVDLPVPLSNLIRTIDPEQDDSGVIIRTIYCLAKLYEDLLFEGTGSGLTVKIVGWPANIEITQFSDLLSQKKPQALIVAAYYFVFTMISDSVWWIADVSGPEIEEIAAEIPFEYQSFMITPLTAVYLHNKWEIVNLLLDQFPSSNLV